MKICPKCNASLEDSAMFCTFCGNSLGETGTTNNAANETNNTTDSNQGTYQQQFNYQQYAPMLEPWDHSNEFDAKDVSENKALAMLLYLIGGIAIIYALLAGQKSEYISFHVRQVLKFMVIEALTAICMGLLVWTVIVPIAGFIFLVVLGVVKIVCFFQVCGNRSVEPAIIRSFGFLK